MSEQIEQILKERGERYGSFEGHAEITQSIKSIMHLTDKWTYLEDDQREALDMVAHKLGRILNGDPNYLDSWADAIGYLKLVYDRLSEGRG